MGQNQKAAETDFMFQYEIRRNPYLVDYERERIAREARRQGRAHAACGGEYRGRPENGGEYRRRPDGAPAREAQGYRGQGSAQGQQGYRGKGSAQGQQGYRGQGSPQGQQEYRGQGSAQGQREYRGQGSAQGQQGYRGQGSLQGQQGYRGQGSAQGQRGYRGQRDPGDVRSLENRQYAQQQSRRRSLSEVPTPRRVTAARRRRRARRQKMLAALCLTAVAVVGAYLFAKGGNANAAGGNRNYGYGQGAAEGGSRTAAADTQGLSAEVFAKHPDWTENFLTPNEYSRPGEPLPEVKNIFVHYTANPGTSAAQNRSYFERQKDEHTASVSAHFIIGYEGEIIQCVPLDEIAYAVRSRNYDSISIECCHLEEDGSFTQETYDSLISLLAWLTESYGLDTEDILRHYDSNGKLCPLYYTEHEDKWEQLKQDVKTARLREG